MKRKSIALLMILCLALMGILGGCGGEKVDAQSLLNEVTSNMESKKSMDATMTMNFDGSIGGSSNGVDASVDMTMDINMDVQSVKDGVTYIVGDFSVSMLGMDVATTIESYSETVDGTEFTYSKTDDSGWEVSESTVEDGSEDATMDLSQMISEGAATATLAEDTQEVNGKEAYVVTVGVGGDALADILSMSGDTGSSLMDTEGLDLSNITLETLMYIDAKERVLLKMDMDLAELGTTMFGSMGEEMGATVNLNEFKLSFAFNGFDTVSDLSIPEDVKSSATSGSLADELDSSMGIVTESDTETEAASGLEGPVTDANGNYILSDYVDDSLQASIGPIDGYELFYGSDTMLSFQNADYTDLTYSFWETDDVKQDMSNLSYMQGDSDYTDIVEGDIQTKAVGDREVSWFRLDYVFMGDSPCVDYYAWIDAGNGTKLICEVSAMGYQEAPNIDDSIVDTIFANVSLVQGSEL